METNFFAFDAASESAHIWSGPTDGPDSECADTVKAAMAMMAELVPGLTQAAGRLGLPPGATIEVEMSLRRRRLTSG